MLFIAYSFCFLIAQMVHSTGVYIYVYFNQQNRLLPDHAWLHNWLSLLEMQTVISWTFVFCRHVA